MASDVDVSDHSQAKCPSCLATRVAAVVVVDQTTAVVRHRYRRSSSMFVVTEDHRCRSSVVPRWLLAGSIVVLHHREDG